jgi:hypothetical protein
LAAGGGQVAQASSDADNLTALTGQIAALSAQVQTLVSAVSALKPETKTKAKTKAKR